MRKLLLLGLLVCCSFAVAQNLSPEVKEFVKVDAPIVVLQHVRVIDGTGAPAREDQTVLVSNGKVESVANAASASVPKGSQVLDLHGYSVLPGLVGMHDHMFYPMGNVIFGEMAFSFPRLYLAGGVTTIRTTGSLEPYRPRNEASDRFRRNARTTYTRYWAVSGRERQLGSAVASTHRA